MVRIIAGRARGLTLQVPEGQRVRPTADRVREALFNVLAHRLHVDFTGLRILDLFAGAGTLGLEALSRGAAELTAVEADAGVARVLTANARRLGAVRVVRQEAARFLAEATDAWDVVFLDPPYHKGLIAPVLAALAAGRLAPDGLAVVEHPADEAMYAPEPLGIRFQRIYGGTGITILGAPPPST
ncbi:MAG: 16S rRNA (guanine(966)-N(2))-methyltransferase RsmD [Myxococcales bacterium]|nr:16S rRNA (guanine(966)-N(2))-methyltransferase RsmD [Myxococcales bacterium]